MAVRANTRHRNDLAAFYTAASAISGGPDDPQVSAMDVRVRYRARIASYSFRMRNGDHAFTYSEEVEGSEGKRFAWNERYLDAFAVRKDFEEVKTPEQAQIFLNGAGKFSPLSESVSWKEFQRWQTLTEMVKLREPLAQAVSAKKRSGDTINAILAMGGVYTSKFFHDREKELRECLAESLDADMIYAVKEGHNQRVMQERRLTSWFGRPPGDALRVELVPEKVTPSLLEKAHRSGSMLHLDQGGFMWELLVRPEKLRPVLVIEGKFVIEAIAATLYADRIAGVKWEKCPSCKETWKPRPRQLYHPKCHEKIRKANWRAKQPA